MQKVDQIPTRGTLALLKKTVTFEPQTESEISNMQRS